MGKIIKDLIIGTIPIIIGLSSAIFFKLVLPGFILIFMGLSIFGINKELRISFLSIIKKFWDKIKNNFSSQNMEDSPGGVQQQPKAGRDAITAGRDVNIIKQLTPQKKKEKTAKLTILYEADETYHNLNITNINPPRKGIFLHLIVKNESDDLARNCYGELIEVWKWNGTAYSKERSFSAPVILKWAHKEFGNLLTIDKDIPRSLDICHTIEGLNYFLFMTEKQPNGIHTDFPKGKYKIKVRVKGDNTDFSCGEFIIEFDGNWSKIKLDNL